MTSFQIPLKLSKGLDIHAWCILPEKPVAVMQLLHGMMEHSERYRPFAEWMAGQGIAVYAADHPGHGISVHSADDLGHLDVKSGWQEIMEAVKAMREHIGREHPDLPVFLMGHSFGSAVARSFVQRYGRELPFAGLILSGAMQQPYPLLHAGLDLITLQKAVYGQRHRSKLMITLGHGQYAKPFAPTRTSFDWLSSVPEVVDAYLADPLCGYACTLGYYLNFFKALKETWKSSGIREMPSQMPVLFMGGSLDPAIRQGKDTQLLAEKYRRCGMQNVTIKLFPAGRHEMLNEANCSEVWEYVKQWIVVSRQSSVIK
jgi:alpha-beta hydrolase superfamily lysophospholipase